MNRPDPDELLDRLQRDEEKARRGKLKIFFGASAGVGETYAMLQAARRPAGEGGDEGGGGLPGRGTAKKADDESRSGRSSETRSRVGRKDEGPRQWQPLTS